MINIVHMIRVMSWDLKKAKALNGMIGVKLGTVLRCLSAFYDASQIEDPVECQKALKKVFETVVFDEGSANELIGQLEIISTPEAENETE